MSLIFALEFVHASMNSQIIFFFFIAFNHLYSFSLLYSQIWSLISLKDAMINSMPKKSKSNWEKPKMEKKLVRYMTHWLATCHWLKVNFTYENKGPRFLQVDTMRQKNHNYTQNFHRNKINWKLSPKKPHFQL